MNQRQETVFIVDDDHAILKALKRLLRAADFTVEIFADPLKFLEDQNPETPGCLILDMAMPGLNGFAVQQRLIDAGNFLPIIFLTAHGDIPMSVRAMKSGVVDFLSKPCGANELLEAVVQALALDQRLRQERSELEALRSLLAALTLREREVMLGVVAGRSNKEIAQELGAAETTIKIHRSRVMTKLQVSSVAELVLFSERSNRSTRSR